MPTNQRLENLEAALQSYLDGQTGIRYDLLISFAEPLFDLFELDLRSAREVGIDRKIDELTTTLAVLDTARLFWSYFQLPETVAIKKLPDLATRFIGSNPAPEDEKGFLELLDLLEERVQELGRTRDSDSGVPGFSLPAFDELLNAFGAREDGQSTDQPDVLALFARPLFEVIDVRDPEAVEDAFARAQAYWELAQMRGTDYDRQLELVTQRFAGARRGRAEIRREAEDMAARFRTLFS